MNKTILITGSTDGIGKLTALQLAKSGHTVYLHGRNHARLESTIQEVREASGSKNVHGFLADFSDLGAVSQMAEEVISQLAKLDILINNAGVYNSKASTNQDGLDYRFVVNYLAPYLLTERLMPLLKKSSSPRIINLGSAAQAPVNSSALLGKEQLTEQAAYAQSKLALTMWTFDLASKQPGLNALVVNPGSLLDTKMAHEAFGQVWAPAEKGADVLFDLALSEEHENASGKYFDNDQGRFGQAHPYAYDQTKIDELMSITEKLVYNISK